MTTHYSPKCHRDYLARRRARVLRTVGKRAKRGAKSVEEAIAVNGERMSEEGRGLLEGLGKVLGSVVKVVRGK